MKRTKLEDRVMPEYTKGEEIFNMTSHIVGAIFGIVIMILCIIRSALHHNGYAVVSSVIYGLSVIVLYVMSSLYHGLKKDSYPKRVFQVLDHCSIFIMIAGCYTPFCLVMFREYNKAFGWGLFAFVWIVAILGIIFNSIDIKKYKKFSMVCYLGMGWCIVISLKNLIELLGIPGFVLLLLGGIIYSIGAFLYSFGKKKKIKYMHSIFHLCILVASILQYISIFMYVL